MSERRMSKHTEGPWEIGKSHQSHVRTPINKGAKHIAMVNFDPIGIQLSEHEANARLIAKAPEMLELLETIENDDKQVPHWLWERIQALIAEARGEG